jgi:hypothetical protein
MPGAFQYKPKFVDIRVRPPKPEEEAAAQSASALEDGKRPCDHPGCRRAAQTRAPKSRDLMNEHYWFCTEHAAEYNRSWDFFAGMTEGQIRAWQAGTTTGERPTWSFQASRRSREAMAARGSTERAFADPFGLFAAARRRAEQAAHERKLGKLERNALVDLDLDATASAPAIRARYIELVKRCHPDANGGDRSAEHKLQRVIKAYQALRKANMA